MSDLSATDELFEVREAGEGRGLGCFATRDIKPWRSSPRNLYNDSLGRKRELGYEGQEDNRPIQGPRG